MKKPNYSLAMWLLYGTCRQLVRNCRAKLAKFQEFSPATYTDAGLDLLDDEIDAAEALASEEARALEHSQLLEELKPLFRICQRKFMFTKNYISLSLDKNVWVINWESAGWLMYDTEMNWSEASNMYAKALLYIQNHSTELTAMPATFLADFTLAVKNYNDKLMAFNNAKTYAAESTDEKINANNSIHEKIIDTICEVGQTIFADDETLRGEFSFEKMSEILRPLGAAGMKGKIMKNGQPVAGLTVILENENKAVITDAEGVFDFGNKLSSGKDKLVIKDGDEILKEEDVILPAGVTKNEEIVLG
ncbi:MAG: carboxypeptidase-like regulatory domain-containing protein, partial [Bacteroidia bacterium]